MEVTLAAAHPCNSESCGVTHWEGIALIVYIMGGTSHKTCVDSNLHVSVTPTYVSAYQTKLSVAPACTLRACTPVAPATKTRKVRDALSLPFSLALLISFSPLSLSSHLFSPPHAEPQWVIWLGYRGSTKYRYTHKYGEAYREGKTYDDPYQHVCTTPKVCTIRIIRTVYVCGIGMDVLSAPSNWSQSGKKNSQEGV